MGIIGERWLKIGCCGLTGGSPSSSILTVMADNDDDEKNGARAQREQWKNLQQCLNPLAWHVCSLWHICMSEHMLWCRIIHHQCDWLPKLTAILWWSKPDGKRNVPHLHRGSSRVCMPYINITALLGRRDGLVDWALDQVTRVRFQVSASLYAFSFVRFESQH